MTEQRGRGGCSGREHCNAVEHAFHPDRRQIAESVFNVVCVRGKNVHILVCFGLHKQGTSRLTGLRMFGNCDAISVQYATVCDSHLCGKPHQRWRVAEFFDIRSWTFRNVSKLTEMYVLRGESTPAGVNRWSSICLFVWLACSVKISQIRAAQAVLIFDQSLVINH